MPLLVRFRPNVPYLFALLLAVVLIALGLALRTLSPVGPWYGWVIAAAGVLLLVMFGYPVVASTVCRVPVIVVSREGIRLPLMGVRVAWPEVARTSRVTDVRRAMPLLLVVPSDPQAVLGRVRPWLRAEARGNIRRYGTPIILSDRSLDHSLGDIADAIARHHPVP